MNDAAESLLKIMDTASRVARADELIAHWLIGEFPCRTLEERARPLLSEFTSRCVSKLESIGDKAFDAEKHDQAATAYSMVLSLNHSTQSPILPKWARAMLTRGSVNEALSAGEKACFPRSSESRHLLIFGLA